MNPDTAKEKARIVISSISEGLSELDSIVLAELSWEQYTKLKTDFPVVSAIIDKAKIEYKRKIISKINQLALAGDVKSIQWIAENGALFSDDFGKKKVVKQDNPLANALKFIQDNAKSPIIKNDTNGN